MQIYFLVITVIVFLYGVRSKSHAVNSVFLVLVLAIFPLFWVPDSHSSHIRLAGVPIFYLPFFALGFIFLTKINFRFNKSHRRLLISTSIFLSYIFVQSITIGDIHFSDISYLISFIINFILFFASLKLFSTLDINRFNNFIALLVKILIIACLVGLSRYIIGISVDTNFIPVVNRNATVVIVIMLTPLVYYLYEIHEISKKKLFMYLSIIFIALIFMLSRSGLLGFILIILLVNFRFSIKNLSKLILVIIPLLLVSSIIFKEHLKRFDIAVTTVKHLQSGEKFDSSMNDYSRVVLLEAGVSLIKNNFWFGTGLGLTNYSKEFKKVSNYPHPKRVHNFYLSYLISLGLIGFSILMLFMRKVYISLENRIFKISFLAVSFLMLMNEYILLPFLWVFYGLLIGVNKKTKV